MINAPHAMLAILVLALDGCARSPFHAMSSEELVVRASEPRPACMGTFDVPVRCALLPNPVDDGPADICEAARRCDEEVRFWRARVVLARRELARREAERSP